MWTAQYSECTEHSVVARGNSCSLFPKTKALPRQKLSISSVPQLVPYSWCEERAHHCPQFVSGSQGRRRNHLYSYNSDSFEYHRKKCSSFQSKLSKETWQFCLPIVTSKMIKMASGFNELLIFISIYFLIIALNIYKNICDLYKHYECQ